MDQLPLSFFGANVQFFHLPYSTASSIQALKLVIIEGVIARVGPADAANTSRCLPVIFCSHSKIVFLDCFFGRDVILSRFCLLPLEQFWTTGQSARGVCRLFPQVDQPF